MPNFTAELIEDFRTKTLDFTSSSVKFNKQEMLDFLDAAAEFRKQAVAKAIELCDREEEAQSLARMLDEADAELAGCYAREQSHLAERDGLTSLAQLHSAAIAEATRHLNSARFYNFQSKINKALSCLMLRLRHTTRTE